MMRTLHRWVSIVAAVFLLNIAITGGLLAIDQLRERLFGFPGVPGMPGMPGPQGPGADVALPGADTVAMMLTSYRAARQVMPAAPITAVKLQMVAGAPQGRITVNGSQPQWLVFDARTGQRLVLGPGGQGMGPWTPQAYDGSHSFHQVLKRLHRGDIFGFSGRWVDITAGLCLLFLGVSALVLYGQMWSQRMRLGRGGWFWR